jgi:GxxExxY protein
MDENSLSNEIICAAIEVHRILGPGPLESACQKCLASELLLTGVAYEKEKALPIHYKGVSLDCGFTEDFCIETGGC